MKNLPDKIYLNLGDLTEEEYNELDFNDLSEVTWSDDDVQGRNVEYVRTDVFIEKVCKFLDDRIKHDSIDYPMATVHLIEDFKNYMKGE